jgi:hypothetical protein
MKSRFGFVSNSSSSSFIIANYNLSLEQINKIVNHSSVAEKDMPEIDCPNDSWTIEVTYEHVQGYTYMDNFDMSTFLKNIGVDSKNIKWEDF